MFKKIISSAVIVTFVLTSIGQYPWAYADQGVGLPAPGTMINLSQAYMPVMIKGVRVHPDNPLLFDFILDSGNTNLDLTGPQFKLESQKLIKYFLASLTIKEDDMWVNLSPYEKDHMIPQELGQTEIGRDMLAQDYILKQLTASLIYPEKDLGKKFWDSVYSKAQEQFGTSNIPVNTFNKVWIVADKAKVLERNNTAYVVGAHLKVMLEEDYLSLAKHAAISTTNSHSIASKVIRQIILPELENEVNQGENFSSLRQMFYSMILATWYKQELKNAFLNQVYSDKAKTSGVLSNDPNAKQEIYQQYLKAYKKGVFNFIKEDVDTVTQQAIPRKYFSGGLAPDLGINAAMKVTRNFSIGDNLGVIGRMALVAIAAVSVQQKAGAQAIIQPKIQNQTIQGRSTNNFNIQIPVKGLQDGYRYQLSNGVLKIDRFRPRPSTEINGYTIDLNNNTVTPQYGRLGGDQTFKATTAQGEDYLLGALRLLADGTRLSETKDKNSLEQVFRAAVDLLPNPLVFSDHFNVKIPVVGYQDGYGFKLSQRVLTAERFRARPSTEINAYALDLNNGNLTPQYGRLGGDQTFAVGTRQNESGIRAVLDFLTNGILASKQDDENKLIVVLKQATELLPYSDSNQNVTARANLVNLAIDVPPFMNHFRGYSLFTDSTNDMLNIAAVDPSWGQMIINYSINFKTGLIVSHEMGSNKNQVTRPVDGGYSSLLSGAIREMKGLRKILSQQNQALLDAWISKTELLKHKQPTIQHIKSVLPEFSVFIETPHQMDSFRNGYSITSANGVLEIIRRKTLSESFDRLSLNSITGNVVTDYPGELGANGFSKSLNRKKDQGSWEGGVEDIISALNNAAAEDPSHKGDYVAWINASYELLNPGISSTTHLQAGDEAVNILVQSSKAQGMGYKVLFSHTGALNMTLTYSTIPAHPETLNYDAKAGTVKVITIDGKADTYQVSSFDGQLRFLAMIEYLRELKGLAPEHLARINSTINNLESVLKHNGTIVIRGQGYLGGGEYAGAEAYTFQMKGNVLNLQVSTGSPVGGSQRYTFNLTTGEIVYNVPDIDRWVSRPGTDHWKGFQEEITKRVLDAIKRSESSDEKQALQKILDRINRDFAMTNEEFVGNQISKLESNYVRDNIKWEKVEPNAVNKAKVLASIEATRPVLTALLEAVDQHPSLSNAKTLILEAIELVFNKQGQNLRKDLKFYPIHPLSVALSFIKDLGITDPDFILSALLHDSIEDVDEYTVNPDLIGQMFGEQVQANVESVTNKPLSAQAKAWLTNYIVQKTGLSPATNQKAFDAVYTILEYQVGVAREIIGHGGTLLLKSADFSDNALKQAGLADKPALQARLSSKYRDLIAIFKEEFLKMAEQETAKGSSANTVLIAGLNKRADDYQAAYQEVSGYASTWEFAHELAWVVTEINKDFGGLRGLSEEIKKHDAAMANRRKDLILGPHKIGRDLYIIPVADLHGNLSSFAVNINQVRREGSAEAQDRLDSVENLNDRDNAMLPKASELSLIGERKYPSASHPNFIVYDLAGKNYVGLTVQYRDNKIHTHLFINNTGTSQGTQVETDFPVTQSLIWKDLIDAINKAHPDNAMRSISLISILNKYLLIAGVGLSMAGCGMMPNKSKPNVKIVTFTYSPTQDSKQNFVNAKLLQLTKDVNERRYTESQKDLQYMIDNPDYFNPNELAKAKQFYSVGRLKELDDDLRLPNLYSGRKDLDRIKSQSEFVTAGAVDQANAKFLQALELEANNDTQRGFLDNAKKDLDKIREFKQENSQDQSGSGSNQAMIPVGGIDLNAKNMSMAVEGQEIKMTLDPAMIAEFRKGNYSGVEGVILRIVPIASALPILGLQLSPTGSSVAQA